MKRLYNTQKIIILLIELFDKRNSELMCGTDSTPLDGSACVDAYISEQVVTVQIWQSVYTQTQNRQRLYTPSNSVSVDTYVLKGRDSTVYTPEWQCLRRRSKLSTGIETVHHWTIVPAQTIASQYRQRDSTHHSMVVSAQTRTSENG